MQMHTHTNVWRAVCSGLISLRPLDAKMDRKKTQMISGGRERERERKRESTKQKKWHRVSASNTGTLPHRVRKKLNDT